MLLCDAEGYLRKEFKEVPDALLEYIEIPPKSPKQRLRKGQHRSQESFEKNNPSFEGQVESSYANIEEDRSSIVSTVEEPGPSSVSPKGKRHKKVGSPVGKCPCLNYRGSS